MEQAQALAELKKSQVEALKVRAGVEGVLEQVKVELGQHVVAGISLAKVTNPKGLPKFLASGPNVLDASKIAAIAMKLEARCRDVEY